MALILCPECGHQVSDKAISCPLCGYPIKLSSEPKKPLEIENTSKKPPNKKRKYKKLPNGFGSIKKLTGKRRKPYAAYPPTKEFSLNGSPKTEAAIGYFEDWHSAYDALREYNHNPYDIKSAEITFRDVYELFYKAKFQDSKKKISKQSEIAYASAFKNCSVLHNMKFLSIKKQEMQKVIDSCPLGYSSIQNIKKLFGQMYKYAIENDITDKNYAQFVVVNIEDDNEKGEPFSQEELNVLWDNSDNETVQIILIMIYSGFRIKAFETIDIDLKERYFRGGVKTAAGKNRIVPIHDSIYPYVQSGILTGFHANEFRNNLFYPVLKKLGIETTASGKKHTPHDCRHTFSWLCDKFKVDDFSKHLLMGHSLGNDVEKSVYGHRTLEELREEIAKIKGNVCH